MAITHAASSVLAFYGFLFVDCAWLGFIGFAVCFDFCQSNVAGDGNCDIWICTLEKVALANRNNNNCWLSVWVVAWIS